MITTNQFNIPVGLPINERFRFLSYIKSVYKVGYLSKAQLTTLSKRFNKDQRTVIKYLNLLIDEGFVGEDEGNIYMRKWAFILNKLDSESLQSFSLGVSDIINKELFEARLLSAKVRAIRKAASYISKEQSWGSSYQIDISTGLLSSICKVSFGKISKLKQLAHNQGLIEVKKQFTYFDSHPRNVKYFGEHKGLFVTPQGKIYKREIDKILSNEKTRKIKNWKN